MKISRKILTVSLIGTTALAVNAKPAMKDYKTVTQPDGSTIRIKTVGDEHLHFTITEDGNLLHLDGDGFYRLGKITADGAVETTGIRPDDLRAASLATKLNDVDFKGIRASRIEKRKAAQSGYGLSQSDYPKFGNPKGLIILVEYSDVKFTTHSNYDATDYFNQMINGDNFSQFGGTGSAKQYFNEQSGGKFVPDFDVLGPVTLPNPRAFYGKNDYWGEDLNPHLMVTHAIEILDPKVNFAEYDTDGDGVIDNVYIFYAGQGEADFGSEDTVWPHAWDVRFAGITKTVDNVIIGHYACSNEWDEKLPSGIGPFLHEFSHVMGLPDLYNTVDGSAIYTPDEYSVLDYGPYNNSGRTPPNYSAFEKNAMGWYEPITLDRAKSVTLETISSGQFGLIPTDKETEFFLIENRQLTGWDAFIPNHGMLIWHIDYVPTVFEENVVNNTKSHQYVDLVEANNKQNFNYSDGYTWPGTSGNTSFTSDTTPALKSWSGKAIDLPITNITEKGDLISFDVKGGDIDDAGISDPGVMEDETPLYFNLQGIRIDNPAKGEIIVMKKGNRITKIIK